MATEKPLADGVLSTTLTTTLYTVPNDMMAKITSVVLCNTSTTTTRNITMKWGGGTKRSFLNTLSMAPGETVILQPGKSLEATNTIQGGQDAGADVEYGISGEENPVFAQ